MGSLTGAAHSVRLNLIQRRQAQDLQDLFGQSFSNLIRDLIAEEYGRRYNLIKSSRRDDNLEPSASPMLTGPGRPESIKD